MSKLYDAITDLSDKLLEEARTSHLKSHAVPWVRYTALAACATFAVGFGGLVLFNGGLGGSAGEGGGGGTTGTDGGVSTFMSYDGPVFPLTMMAENDGITAVRNIDFDFSPYMPYEHSYTSNDGETHTYTQRSNDLLVTDGYALTNTTDADQTVELLYPVVGDLRRSVETLPSLTVDGEAVEATLHFGAYNGSFQGVYGSEEEGLYNLDAIDDWSGYQDLLSDGQYQEDAFAQPLPLDQAVIVYEFTDHYADFTQGTNPTLGVLYGMDYDKTIILSYGFNGGSFDSEGGTQRRSYSIPEPEERGYDEPRYLIVMGDDIQNLTTQGYGNGGCDAGDEIDSPTATMTRYTSTLGEMLTVLSTDFVADYLENGEDDIGDLLSPETYTNLSAQLLYRYGALAPTLISRYDNGMLEDIISEALSMDRVIYSRFTVTIPAGSTVDVTATMVKEASYDYYGASDGPSTYGYDMATQLGSNLTITTQIASVDTHDLVDIVNQNFGFDVANGVTEVTLDANVEQYYMEVVRAETE